MYIIAILFMFSSTLLIPSLEKEESNYVATWGKVFYKMIRHRGHMAFFFWLTINGGGVFEASFSSWKIEPQVS